MAKSVPRDLNQRQATLAQLLMARIESQSQQWRAPAREREKRQPRQRQHPKLVRSLTSLYCWQPLSYIILFTLLDIGRRRVFVIVLLRFHALPLIAIGLLYLFGVFSSSRAVQGELPLVLFSSRCIARSELIFATFRAFANSPAPVLLACCTITLLLSLLLLYEARERASSFNKFVWQTTHLRELHLSICLFVQLYIHSPFSPAFSCQLVS